MKNYVTSAVLEEAPCMSSKCFFNDKLDIDEVLVAKLTTSKGDFIAFYKSTPTSLIRELANLKVGDKIDIFFRFETLQLWPFKVQEKCFYDVKIHEGDIMRFKQCLWHEEMPVIARIDMVKAKYGLPFETTKTKKMPRFKNWMKPKKTEDKITLNSVFSADAPYLFIALFFAVLFCVGSFFVV